MAKDKRNQNNYDEFGEFMPAYMNQADMFEAADDPAEDGTARRAILKQLGWVVIMLVVQIILFAVLISNTVNLT